MTTSEQLAGFVANTPPGDIPPHVRDITSLLLLDSVSTAVGNRNEPFVRALLQVVAAVGETRSSTVLGHSVSAIGAESAAEVNSAAIHGSDLDATHIESIIHPTAIAVPVGLAVGERADATTSETMASIALGMEALVRLGLAARGAYHVRGFQATAVLGPVVAAMMATRLAGGGAAQANEAAGLATSIAAGLRSFSDDGTWGKRLITGWACRAGIHASDLVRAGFRGSRDGLEKRWGLYEAFLPSDAYDLAAVTDGLGRAWRVVDTEPKRYPCSHGLHPFIERARAVRTLVDLERVERIECFVNDEAKRWWFEPEPARYRPDPYAARFSIPYTVARALVDGDVSDEAFSQAAVLDPTVLGITALVQPLLDPALAQRVPVGLPGRILVRFHDGSTMEAPDVGHASDDAAFIRARASRAIAHALGRRAADALQERVEAAWSDEPIRDLLAAARPSGT